MKSCRTLPMCLEMLRFSLLKYIEDLKLTAFYATDPGCNGGTVIDNPDTLHGACGTCTPGQTCYKSSVNVKSCSTCVRSQEKKI